MLGGVQIPPAQLSAAEQAQVEAAEETTLRQLRMYLRNVANGMLRDRKYTYFTEPVDRDSVPDYYEVVKHPMDLGMLIDRLNDQVYESADQFMVDVRRIKANAFMYNSNSGRGRRIRDAACALVDEGMHLIENATLEHGDLIADCERIAASRRRRRAEGKRPAVDAHPPKVVAPAAGSDSDGTSDADTDGGGGAAEEPTAIEAGSGDGAGAAEDGSVKEATASSEEEEEREVELDRKALRRWEQRMVALTVGRPRRGEGQAGALCSPPPAPTRACRLDGAPSSCWHCGQSASARCTPTAPRGAKPGCSQHSRRWRSCM